MIKTGQIYYSPEDNELTEIVNYNPDLKWVTFLVKTLPAFKFFVGDFHPLSLPKDRFLEIFEYIGKV